MLVDYEIALGAPDWISPYDVRRVQPTSYMVRLGSEFVIYKGERSPSPGEPETPAILDTLESVPDKYVMRTWVKEGDPFVLYPGQFILGHTIEVLTLPRDITVTLAGRSTLARYGLSIHETAGHAEAGFEGQLTLEMSNNNRNALRLYVGMEIGQLIFTRHAAVAIPYGATKRCNRYLGQMGAQLPRPRRTP